MNGAIQQFSTFVRLYPDVVRPAAAALTCLFVAIGAGWAERRRMNRSQLDAVGFMPWTSISVLALFTALACAAFAGKDWLAG